MSDETACEIEGYITATEAVEQCSFTPLQLRSLVGAGVLRTARAKRGVIVYCREDLARLEGAPRVEPDDEPSEVVVEMRAINAAWKDVLDVALKQTKQAQEHERLIVTAFSKPLETLMTGVQQQVGAMVTQNEQLLTRATAGDVARLDFVKAAETMLRERRNEDAQLDDARQKQQIRSEAWEAVKKAGPHLLEGIKKTVGGDGEQLKAALLLREKFDIGKVAALASFMSSEETDLLCKAFGYDRAELDRINAEATAEQAAEAARAAAEPAAAE